MIKPLKTFFEEKQLPTVNWELTSTNGTVNFISNEIVIDAIGKTSIPEQKSIFKMIIMIDYKNGDVNHYLKHLAGALVG